MKVSEQIISVLNAFCEKIGVAIDWTAENVIPYVEKLCGKYIIYEIATSLVWVVVAAIISIIGIILIKTFNKNKNWGVTIYSSIDKDIIGRVFMYIGAYFLLFISMLMVTEQAFDIVTCLTFPEKIIFDGLMALTN